MFAAGDRIVHPMHGAGIVQKITQQRFDGNQRDYYVVNMVAGNMTVLIPCDNDGLGIRPVIDGEAAQKILRKLTEEQIDSTQNWNKRYRDNIEKIKSGDLEQVAVVIKTLVLRDRERGLSTGERKLLSTTKQILISEIALALDIEYKEAEHIVNRQLI